jgi:hypothetical protein
MTSLYNTLRRVTTRAVAVGVAVWIAYRFFLWRKYLALMRKSGLPMVRLLDSRWYMEPLGNLFYSLANWTRLYDAKHDNFKALGMPLTVAVPPPIWSKLNDNVRAVRLTSFGSP